MVNWALKEWAVAVSALLAGDTILLVRKGGIREQKGQFSLATRRVLLLPTQEHQNPDLLKPPYRPGISPAEPQAQRETVTFEGWAEITHGFVLKPSPDLSNLLPHLIWNQQFLQDRLQWQPDRPLYSLLLRAYRLPNPVVLPWQKAYGGCRSWVEIGTTMAVDTSQPALSTADYEQRVGAIAANLPPFTLAIEPS
jgi:hypothetical protein